MEKNKLDELAVDLAEKYGVPIEDTQRIINNVIVVVSDVVSAIKNLWEIIKEAADQLLVHEEEWDSKEKWSIVWDTRKKSQVMLNKPKFRVRKVIR